MAVLKFKYSVYIAHDYLEKQMENWNELNIEYIFAQTFKFINEAYHLKIARNYYNQVLTNIAKESI